MKITSRGFWDWVELSQYKSVHNAIADTWSLRNLWAHIYLSLKANMNFWDTPETQGEPHVLQKWHFFCIPLKFDQSIQTHWTCDLSDYRRHSNVFRGAEMMVLWLGSDHKLTYMSGNVESSLQHRQGNSALFSRMQHDGLVEDRWDTRKDILRLRVDINRLSRAIQNITDVL